MLPLLGWPSAIRRNDLQLIQAQHQNDLQITHNEQQATLDSYLDQKTDLILNTSLNNPKTEVEIWALARARTLTTPLLLDPNRKATLIQFLYASRLIDTSGPVIDLEGAELRDVDLNQTFLEGIDLSGADLIGANFDNIDLSNANLSGTKVIDEQLALAKSLKGAVLPDGSKIRRRA